MIFVQLAVLLICIFIGSRMSGIGLGVMGMIGLLILTFCFDMQPADPPLEVMLIILSVATASAVIAGLILQSILLQTFNLINPQMKFGSLSLRGSQCLLSEPLCNFVSQRATE